MNVNYGNSAIKKNTFMLLLLNIAKLFFPFITLPYLTRVLSTDVYGSVAYVKAVMGYMQILIDFGFALSATKHIVEKKEDVEELGYIIGENLLAKCILAIFGACIVGIMIYLIPILNDKVLFVWLSYSVVILSIFMFDFFFRGIEKMHVITLRFFTMKSISTALTFVLVKSDSDILLIPILDFLGSLVAIILVLIELKKYGLKVKCAGIGRSIKSIQESCVYFISNVASTSFNLLGTIIIGIVLKPTDVALWSICLQIINAMQALYTPISDAIYPEMIRRKDLSIVRNAIRKFTPFLGLGCILIFAFAKEVLYILGGDKYLEAQWILRISIPSIFCGFFSVLLGWPSLGAIGKNNETTQTTICAALFQMVGLIILLEGNFSLLGVAAIRSLTELLLCSYRFYFVRKNIEYFC